jgi:hypothetical protein
MIGRCPVVWIVILAVTMLAANTTQVAAHDAPGLSVLPGAVIAVAHGASAGGNDADPHHPPHPSGHPGSINECFGTSCTAFVFILPSMHPLPAGEGEGRFTLSHLILSGWTTSPPRRPPRATV